MSFQINLQLMKKAEEDIKYLFERWEFLLVKVCALEERINAQSKDMEFFDNTWPKCRKTVSDSINKVKSIEREVNELKKRPRKAKSTAKAKANNAPRKVRKRNNKRA